MSATTALRALLPRYVRALPRYTSYPTAPMWGEAFGPDEYRDALAQVRGDISVYVHVPFCRSLCHFCACNRIITRDEAVPARYLDTLEQEVARTRRELPEHIGAAQLHLGGGTPTHLSARQLERLVHFVTDAFPLRPGAEVSLEVDPRVTTSEHVAAIRACGFDRVSLGVQDFDPTVQEAIHRIQPESVTRKLVADLRAAGVSSLAFDLIYGLPFQTPASFERSLDAVLALSPDRIAIYSYAHVTWVAKQQRGFERQDLPSAQTKLELFALALERLTDGGYVYIGLDHFAKPTDPLSHALENDTLRRNFMGYTTRAGLDLLGFGPSAISEAAGTYAQNCRGLDEWTTAVRAGELATLRGHRLTADDVSRRFVIARLLCQGSLDEEEYAARFGERFDARYAAELVRLEPMRRDGLVEDLPRGGLRLSADGRVLARNVAAVFDAYLPANERETEANPEAKTGAKDAPPRFSQSV